MDKIQVYTLQNYASIPQMSQVDDSIKRDIEVIGRVLPFKTNNYVVDELIDWGNVETNPMFTLNFPRKGMLSEQNYNKIARLLDRGAPQNEIDEAVHRIRLSLNPNPAGQEHNVPLLGDIKLRGVQHKYNETVLFFPGQGQTCHAYCTFCFRWPQFSGMQGLKFAMKETDLLVKYLEIHKKVTDILFTGGDPMTMNASLLESYIEPLLGIEHLHSIRIGSKALTYWPYRFFRDEDSDRIISLFERIVRSGKSLSFQAHFNHPAELSTPAVRTAVARIKSTGAQIRTQSPLLRHINDDPELWSLMWRRQVDMGMIPYYMFVARDTGAKEYFEIPLDRCWSIFRKAYRNVSGLCRTVRGPSMSDHAGKIQVVGVSKVAGEKVFVLRFIQARNASWTHKPFFAKYDPRATWFSQLEPAFGEEKFFFEQERGKIAETKPFLFE